MEKKNDFSKETMTEFTKLLDTKEINLLGINDMKKEHLIEVSHKIGLENVRDKSLEMLRGEIGHLSKIFLAGQVCTISSLVCTITAAGPASDTTPCSSTSTYKVSQKNKSGVCLNISTTKYQSFKYFFFSWKLEIHTPDSSVKVVTSCHFRVFEILENLIFRYLSYLYCCKF